MNRLKFATPEAEQLFRSLCEATREQPDAAIAEAAANLLAMTIAHSSCSVDEAEERVITITAAIVLDFKATWPVAAASRKAPLS